MLALFNQRICKNATSAIAGAKSSAVEVTVHPMQFNLG